jgi:putative ABC transport system ATP-binding protein
MTAPVLRCEAVGRSFGTEVVVRAVKSATLEIRTGETVAITGPSGSGKSTLLHLLGLLDTPTTGTYIVDGTPTQDLSERERDVLRGRTFGFVFQAFHLIDGRTATDNVMLGCLYDGSRPDERRRRALEQLEAVGLGHRVDADTRSLSGGERQRVAIARALVSGCRVLLCDEPTGNLDQTTSRSVEDLLRGLADNGRAVVIVTHDGAIAQRADRTVRVVDGVTGEGGR